MRSLEASLLTDMELKQIFIEGLGKLNVTSGPNLVDIEFTRKLIISYYAKKRLLIDCKCQLTSILI